MVAAFPDNWTPLMHMFRRRPRAVSWDLRYGFKRGFKTSVAKFGRAHNLTPTLFNLVPTGSFELQSHALGLNPHFFTHEVITPWTDLFFGLPPPLLDF
jgi:hypothetical protein